MSGRLLRHGAVLAGVALLGTGLAAWLSAMLPAGFLAAQAAAAEKNPFAVSTKPDTKPVASSKPAAPAPANPFEDPFALEPATGKKPAPAEPAAAPAKPATRSPAPPTASTRGAVVQFSGGEAAIEKALAEPTKAEFHQTPLDDVVEHLADLHRIPIVLDRRVEEMSVDPSTMHVTYAGRAPLSLRSVLDLILRELGLTWTIRSEVLFITTPDVADSMFITKVYDVADLVRCRDEKDMPWDDYDSLIDAIETTVEFDSWMDSGMGVGAIVGQTFGNARVLVVSNTYRIHVEVARLLEDLRKVGSKAGPDQKPPLRRRPNSDPPPGQGSGTNPPRGVPGFM